MRHTEKDQIVTIARRVYQKLADQIIAGELTPGQKLEEIALAEQFGVSRTPVREALRELTAKGLAESMPRKGVTVARIGIEQLTDMLEAECEIEALCARLASQKLNALEKQQLQIIHDRGAMTVNTEDLSCYLALAEQLHTFIASGSRNLTLISTVRALRDRLAPFRRAQPGNIKPRLSRAVEEHRLIVNAIINGDPEAAYAAMRTHNARLSTGVLFRLHEQAKTEKHLEPELNMVQRPSAKVPGSRLPIKGSVLSGHDPKRVRKGRRRPSTRSKC